MIIFIFLAIIPVTLLTLSVIMIMPVWLTGGIINLIFGKNKTLFGI
jgi:hypothetical protein